MSHRAATFGGGGRFPDHNLAPELQPKRWAKLAFWGFPTFRFGNLCLALSSSPTAVLTFCGFKCLAAFCFPIWAPGTLTSSA